MKLEELRKNIDYIDDDIIRLLIERFKIVEQIISLKSNIEDRDREKEILDKIRIATDNQVNPKFFTELYNMIFKESKRIQKELKNSRG